MYTTRVFEKMYDAWRQHPRYISSCGGARSGKTFSALTLLFYIADKYDKAGDVTSVVSETFPHLKRGAIRDFRNLLGDAFDENAWSKTESTYTLRNGAVIEFFSCDNAGKVHGPQRKRLFVNEVQNIKEETLRQLAIRTEELILLDYNPTHSFFVNEKIEARDDCIRIHSTYKDNTFLSPLQVAEIEANRGDANWWRVYGEGRTGELEGVIYEFEQVDALPHDTSLIETFGLDFGYTNGQTAGIRALIDTRNKAVYLDEMFYGVGYSNAKIISALRTNNVTRTATLFCDAAEPKTIDEIHAAGFNARPSDKRGRKAEQIEVIKGWKIYVTKRSLNIIAEMREYTWQRDKNGKLINEPSTIGDHTMDAFRYGVFPYVQAHTNSVTKMRSPRMSNDDKYSV